MSYHEKWSWASGVIAVIAYGGYLAVVAPRLGDAPAADVEYATAMLVTIGAAIVAGILCGIVLGMFRPRGETQEDERDRQIARFGDHVGHAFVVVGGVAVMVLAVLDVDGFWIANVMYLCFVLSGVLSSTARIVAYRRGLPAW